MTAQRTRNWWHVGHTAYFPGFCKGATLALDLRTWRAAVWLDNQVIGTARTLREAQRVVERYLSMKESETING